MSALTSHRMHWFAVDPSVPFGQEGHYVARTRLMKARDQLGWDVICSCGWESCTGGAIQAEVKRMIDQHRCDAQFDATHTWNGREWVRHESQQEISQADLLTPDPAGTVEP